MESTTKKYILNTKIKDEKFNIDELEHYCLSILVGEQNLQICITDIRSSTCLLLEDFSYDQGDLIEILRQIYEDHHLLQAGFWNNIKITFCNQKFTLIPTNLFSINQTEEYLKDTTDINLLNDKSLYYKHIKEDCTSLFAVNNTLVEFFSEIYKNLKVHFLHESSVMIEGVLRYDDHTELKGLFLNFNNDHFQVVVTKNRNLEYYNSFETINPEKTLNYLMILMDELELDQESTKVLVWGDIDSSSDVFTLLYQYIRNISFGNRPGYVKTGYVFDSVPEHKYFSLLSIYPCD